MLRDKREQAELNSVIRLCTYVSRPLDKYYSYNTPAQCTISQKSKILHRCLSNYYEAVITVALFTSLDLLLCMITWNFIWRSTSLRIECLFASIGISIREPIYPPPEVCRPWNDCNLNWSLFGGLLEGCLDLHQII